MLKKRERERKTPNYSLNILIAVYKETLLCCSCWRLCKTWLFVQMEVVTNRNERKRVELSCFIYTTSVMHFIFVLGRCLSHSPFFYFTPPPTAADDLSGKESTIKILNTTKYCTLFTLASALRQRICIHF